MSVENIEIERDFHVEGELEPEFVLEPEYARLAEHGQGQRQRQQPELLQPQPLWQNIQAAEDAIQNVLAEVNRRKIRAQELAENNPTFARYQIYLATQHEDPEEEARVMRMFYNQNEFSAMLHRLQERIAREHSEEAGSSTGNHNRRCQSGPNLPDVE